MSGRATASRRGATKGISGPRQPHRSVVERSGTAPHIDAIRIKLGFPAEVFEEAVRLVIEAYGEFVECLPPAEPHHRDFVERITYSIEMAGLALDLRRDQILPPRAAPEAIGEHAQRWTYAVFLAALLRDVGKDNRELNSISLRDHALDGSLGLGLFIAREIATAHGGDIEARSDENETVFAVRLPRSR